MQVIAFIIDHQVVDQILCHLERRTGGAPVRGPPGQTDLAAVS
jgi:hypothetical protein